MHSVCPHPQVAYISYTLAARIPCVLTALVVVKPGSNLQYNPLEYNILAPRIPLFSRRFESVKFGR